MNLLRKFITTFLIPSFLLTSVIPIQLVHAQNVSLGQMISVSPAFIPASLRGMIIHPENPFQFDFVFDSGDQTFNTDQQKKESEKLIKYFLASLTLPEKELWVNLSPNEPNRIISDELGQTQMGQILLTQDYLLKQLTASLMYPEKELGKKFWDRVYQEAKERYGISKLPVSTLNKVWIVPDKASIYEQRDRVFIVESHLQVMLEEDYVALQQNKNNATSRATSSPDSLRGITAEKYEALQRKSLVSEDGTRDDFNSRRMTAQLMREILIPAIEVEVNEGKNFAQLRQIYNSFILASWYKKNLKQSLLARNYSDQKKISGLETTDGEIKEKIYEQYLSAFRQGAYNYIKEDYNPATQEVVERKYFSGGIVIKDSAQLVDKPFQPHGDLKIVSTRMTDPTSKTIVPLLKEDYPAFVKRAKHLKARMDALVTQGKAMVLTAEEFKEMIKAFFPERFKEGFDLSPNALQWPVYLISGDEYWNEVGTKSISDEHKEFVDSFSDNSFELVQQYSSLILYLKNGGFSKVKLMLEKMRHEGRVFWKGLEQEFYLSIVMEELGHVLALQPGVASFTTKLLKEGLWKSDPSVHPIMGAYFFLLNPSVGVLSVDSKSRELALDNPSLVKDVLTAISIYLFGRLVPELMSDAWLDSAMTAQHDDVHPHVKIRREKRRLQRQAKWLTAQMDQLVKEGLAVKLEPEEFKKILRKAYPHLFIHGQIEFASQAFHWHIYISRKLGTFPSYGQNVFAKIWDSYNVYVNRIDRLGKKGIALEPEESVLIVGAPDVDEFLKYFLSQLTEEYDATIPPSIREDGFLYKLRLQHMIGHLVVWQREVAATTLKFIEHADWPDQKVSMHRLMDMMDYLIPGEEGDKKDFYRLPLVKRNPILSRDMLKAESQYFFGRVLSELQVEPPPETSTSRSDDSAMTAQKNGGIDLNADYMKWTKSGEGADFTFPKDSPELKNIQIHGLVPIIINIAPVTNLPKILGLNKSSRDQIYTSSRFVD